MSNVNLECASWVWPPLLYLPQILNHILFGSNCCNYSLNFILDLLLFMTMYFWLLYFLPNWITSTKSVSSSLLIFTCCRCPSAMLLILMLKTSGFLWLSSLYLICKLPAEINHTSNIIPYLCNRKCRSHKMLPVSQECKDYCQAKQMFDLF